MLSEYDFSSNGALLEYVFDVHIDVLHNQFEPFSQIYGNLPMVETLPPISAGFSFTGAYFHSVNSFSRIFLTLFTAKTL